MGAGASLQGSWAGGRGPPTRLQRLMTGRRDPKWVHLLVQVDVPDRQRQSRCWGPTRERKGLGFNDTASQMPKPGGLRTWLCSGC